MHSLANCKSRDLSTSSKTSKNVLDRMCKIKDGQGIASMQHNNMPTSPPNKKLSNPPQDLNDCFISSDSEDCESVGSNSPKYECVNKASKNQKSSIHSNNIPIREDSSKIHVGARNMEKETTKTRGDLVENHGLESIPILKNMLSTMTPPKTNLNISNKTNDAKSKKHLKVGQLEHGLHDHTKYTLNKVSKTHHTNYSSTSIKDSPFTQNNESRKCNNQKTMKLDDYITFDEGDGGGPPNTTNKYNVHKHKTNASHLSQNQNGKDQEPFDEGDGGGYGSSNQVTSRRHRKHGKHARYGTRPSSGSQESNRSRRSRSGSQESNRHYKSVGRGHRRESRGGSHQSSLKSSRSSSHSSTRSWTDDCGLCVLSDTKPYPAKWRYFGRRPPAIHEFRPMGEARVKNVRPAGKPGYQGRIADEKLGCRGPDAWDVCYGVAKPITDQWSTPITYGKNVQVGDIDPQFCPSRGDLVIINPAQNFYRDMKSGFVITYSGQDYSFGVGDLIVHLGRFMPSGDYIPYGNLELYMHTQTREMRLLGFQPPLLVDFNYHNLDYESPGKQVAIGTFLNESFFPRRGDIIIHGGTWAQNYPNIQCKHHSSVKYWRPRMEFFPNDMLLRPYVDIGSKRNPTGGKFYWGVVELYTYSGKGLAWVYWGRDHHIYDTPHPCEQEHGIRVSHQKDGVSQKSHSPGGGGYSHGHQAADDEHREHNPSGRYHSQGHSLHRTSPRT